MITVTEKYWGDLINVEDKRDGEGLDTDPVNYLFYYINYYAIEDSPNGARDRRILRLYVQNIMTNNNAGFAQISNMFNLKVNRIREIVNKQLHIVNINYRSKFDDHFNESVRRCYEKYGYKRVKMSSCSKPKEVEKKGTHKYWRSLKDKSEAYRRKTVREKIYESIRMKNIAEINSIANPNVMNDIKIIKAKSKEFYHRGTLYKFGDKVRFLGLIMEWYLIGYIPNQDYPIMVMNNHGVISKFESNLLEGRC